MGGDPCTTSKSVFLFPRCECHTSKVLHNTFSISSPPCKVEQRKRAHIHVEDDTFQKLDDVHHLKFLFPLILPCPRRSFGARRGPFSKYAASFPRASASNFRQRWRRAFRTKSDRTNGGGQHFLSEKAAAIYTRLRTRAMHKRQTHHLPSRVVQHWKNTNFKVTSVSPCLGIASFKDVRVAMLSAVLLARVGSAPCSTPPASTRRGLSAPVLSRSARRTWPTRWSQ